MAMDQGITSVPSAKRGTVAYLSIKAESAVAFLSGEDAVGRHLGLVAFVDASPTRS